MQVEPGMNAALWLDAEWHSIRVKCSGALLKQQNNQLVGRKKNTGSYLLID